MRQFDSYANGGQGNVEWTTALGEVIPADAAQLYGNAFSQSYQQDFDATTASHDIEMMQRLQLPGSIAVHLYRDSGDEDKVLRFRLLRAGEPVALSDVLPLLENFGLRVIGEHPYQVNNAAGQQFWLHVFELHHGFDQQVDVEEAAPAFAAAFHSVWNGDVESDTFNRLVLGVRMDWRCVAMLRAYSRYMKQLNLNFARPFIANTLSNHLDIAASLAQLFDCRFNPANATSDEQRQAACASIVESVRSALDNVENLNEDKVIRQYLTLIQATLRTNYYQQQNDNQPKEYFCFKFDVEAIPEAPRPRPVFEIFVYSPRLEGVHLRGGKVARGGLRWSDRQEDFRTEVLGLVKAQQVKNSVIVPLGAKGGFVCKQQQENASREQVQAEGVACYRTFISALLDVTDNLVGGEVVKPGAVVCHDGDDPYLVVAADKGTATFSDIANEISMQYGFWLGDAFASGGSVGYDHKKMGITAKGAWVSVQRHFRELGLNVQEDDFTVVGIGDMGGDVFGNGMLCSEHIRLVAAFNHMHIFIDPDPVASSSFAERKRLFDMPGSSWSDYSTDLISKGGGVYSRNAKSIAISEQMKKRFGIEADSLVPNELIQAIFRAKVDLLWNGGIGTYVKAQSETHADVGDKASDCVRVDACELGARVIGEGGNLGLTQLARAEFGLNGGRCNTDFIDNAAGVDCSDHEVNIKILLNQLVADGVMGEEDRNRTLESMTDAVSELVLENNYRQTLAISIAEHESMQRAVEYRRLVSHYESLGKLDRELEFIPCDETLAERKASGQSLTRAELSVLVSYSKLLLKQSLVETDIAQDEYIARAAQEAFPPFIRQQFASQVDSHQLHNELVSTQVAGDLVNRMGMTFVHRMQQATGECDASIAKAYVTARDLFDIDQHWRAIESLDFTISAELQHELYSMLIRLVRRATRWLLRARRANIDPAKEIANFKPAAELLSANIQSLLQGGQVPQWQEQVARYVEAGVPGELAQFVASTRYLFATFAVAEVAASSGANLANSADCYFMLGERLELNWFAEQIVQMGVENYWQAMARESFRDELEGQQAMLATVLMTSVGDSGYDGGNMLSNWFAQHEAYIDRWQHMMAELRCTTELDLAMFPVAIRELLDLSQASQQAVA